MERKAKLGINEYFRIITGKMMFVQGDAEEPLESCVDLVFDLVKYELVHVLEETRFYESLKNEKKGKITLKSIMYIFRKNHMLLRRLVKLAETASSIHSLSKDGGNTPGSSSGSEFSEDDPEAQQTKKVTGKLHKDILEAIDYMHCFEFENDDDLVLGMRQKRLAARVSSLNMDQYERFTSARLATFSTINNKGGKTSKKDLKTWLECPPICNSTEFVLGFLARETVALLVEDALTVREQEKSNWFKNEGEPDNIQLRHYEEALRRNLGYRYRQDLLFGYPTLSSP